MKWSNSRKEQGLWSQADQGLTTGYQNLSSRSSAGSSEIFEDPKNYFFKFSPEDMFLLILEREGEKWVGWTEKKREKH